MTLWTALTSIHGKLIGLHKDRHLISDGDILVPHWSNPAVKVRHFDDFMGDLVTDEWTVNLGSGGATAGAISAGIGGLFLLTSDDTAGTMAADGAQIVGARNFEADNGHLVFECRIRMNSAITATTIFAGFTDVTTIECAIVSAASADTITTTATDAVGFMYDSRMDTDTWWAVGVANDVDASHASTGVAPTADTWDKLRVEVDTAGIAKFYVNGVHKKTLSGCVTPTVDLCPTVAIFANAAGAVKTVTVDYILAEMDR